MTPEQAKQIESNLTQMGKWLRRLRVVLILLLIVTALRVGLLVLQVIGWVPWP